MSYARLVIDTLKEALSSYISTGEINVESVNDAIRQLEFEADRRAVSLETPEDIERLREDLIWLKCDLMEYE